MKSDPWGNEKTPQAKRSGGTEGRQENKVLAVNMTTDRLCSRVWSMSGRGEGRDGDGTHT